MPFLVAWNTSDNQTKITPIATADTSDKAKELAALAASEIASHSTVVVKWTNEQAYWRGEFEVEAFSSVLLWYVFVIWLPSNSLTVSK